MTNFKHSGKMKAVTFSYDDGVIQDIHLIELLNKYNLKCTFNLNSELLGREGILPFHTQKIAHYKIRPEDVPYVYEGHEIAAHTLTHPHLPLVSDEEVVRQVEQDRLKLSELAGYEVVGMAYPGGGVNNDDRVAEIIRTQTGIQYARTITSTHNFDPQTYLHRFNPTVHDMEWDTMMDLAQKFVALTPDTPQILYIWGHSYEMDIESDYWVRMEDLFRLLAGRSDIFYGTNKEVLL
ncbi:MAG: polysaccharide deacetylase family protein [Clostridia bacterium]|nr:polysaccharide deacetylase family protein [Clostridia bacterium]